MEKVNFTFLLHGDPKSPIAEPQPFLLLETFSLKFSLLVKSVLLEENKPVTWKIFLKGFLFAILKKKTISHFITFLAPKLNLT